MSGRASHEPLYVAARRALLDTLEALGPQREAIVLVGAQAIYLHTGDADLAVAPYTTDADLAINPDRLGDEPLLEKAMSEAGFHLRQPQPGRNEPGIWIRTETLGDQTIDVPVDLLVPERFAPRPGRRSAHLPPHERTAARRTPGLEPVLLDQDPREIPSLEPETDHRRFTIAIAGPAALLIAKTHKLSDRVADARKGRAGRTDAKDAADVVRLMRTQPITDMQARMRKVLRAEPHGGDPRISEVAEQGLAQLDRLFGQPRSPGTELAVTALADALPEDHVRALCPAYTRALIDSLADDSV